MPICEIQNLSKVYGTGPARVEALKQVTLSIEAGEFSVFCGPSGSGKTTLLNHIGCLDAPDEGSLAIEGVATRSLSLRAL